MDEARLATTHCVAYIERQALRKPFRQVAREVNASDKTVKAIHIAHVARLEREHRFETPEIIGIDGVYVGRKERLIIIDQHRGLVLGMWPSIKERAVFNALCLLPDCECVLVVTMDMSHSLRRAVEAALPGARIMIDRYHVLSLANNAVDRVQIDLRGDTSERRNMIVRHLLRRHEGQLWAVERAQLDWWLGLVPELMGAYEAKEAFFPLFNFLSSGEAIEAYEEWRSGLSKLPALVRTAFQAQVVKTVDNWRSEIFAACDYPEVTNGFAKSINR